MAALLLCLGAAGCGLFSDGGDGAKGLIYGAGTSAAAGGAFGAIEGGGPGAMLGAGKGAVSGTANQILGPTAQPSGYEQQGGPYQTGRQGSGSQGGTYGSAAPYPGAAGGTYPGGGYQGGGLAQYPQGLGGAYGGSAVSAAGQYPAGAAANVGGTVGQGALSSVAPQAAPLGGAAGALVGSAAYPAASNALPSGEPVLSAREAPSSSPDTSGAPRSFAGPAPTPAPSSIVIAPQAMDTAATSARPEWHLVREAGAGEPGPKASTSTALVLPCDETFVSGSGTITTAGQKRIDAVARQLKGYQDAVIVVVGHTDNRGSTASNRELSQERAGAVAEALVARGISRARLTVRGVADAQPAASNDTTQGRALNRRIEILVGPAAASSSASWPGSIPGSENEPR